MKTAYLDCFSGLSGDMFLGALLDAGLSLSALRSALGVLPLDKYRIEAKKEQRGGITGTKFTLEVMDPDPAPRTFRTIRDMLDRSPLSRIVRERSISVFELLAHVEGEIHGIPPEDVHFHEIGAVDSIADVVGSVFGLEALEIGRLTASPIPLGSGFAESRHGRIPVPSPATVALLKDVPVFDSGVRQEMVTPTGAALLKVFAQSYGPLPPMVIQNVGYGAGSRALPDRPNLVRLIIGEEGLGGGADTVVVLESNLDDASPEWLGYLMDTLFEAGALDVAFCPVHMKKNRPGVQVQVMARPEDRERFTEILFRESTTLGVRFQHVQRTVLPRSFSDVETPWGTVTVKKIPDRQGSFFLLPEYESCREAARKSGRPLREIICWVLGLNRQS